MKANSNKRGGGA
jgi:hypothetical protein